MYNIKMLTNFFEELSTLEIKRINKKTVLIFPFSSIEQHGSHLPVGTDKKILEGILNKFNNKYTSKKYLIMPQIYIGSASEHKAYDGTISLDSIDFINYSVKIIDQFCKKKFKNIFLLNSHGGQINHIDIIAKELKAKYDIKIIRGTYFLFDDFKTIISKKEKEFGYHGGEFETKLMLYLFPDLVKLGRFIKYKYSSDYKSKKIIHRKKFNGYKFF
jgi:Uncharacterized protein, putative amidase